MRQVRSLIYGVTLPARAAALILSHPVLIAWSLLPIGVTLVLYYLVIHSLSGLVRSWLAVHLATWHWNPNGFAAIVFSFFVHVLLLLVGAISFSFVAGIAASPFNDFLAESSEKWATPPLPPVQDRSILIKARLILIDAGKSIAATFAGLAALLLVWVPVVNAITFLLTFLLLTFQYISYPQTRRKQGLGDGIRFLWDHLFACIGFGAALSVLFTIPLISSLALPLAVVGGTLLVARAQGKGSDRLC